jgi:NAD(P)-dependent dehydrogenase (short-subunit alcohol dehydrogenase family)
VADTGLRGKVAIVTGGSKGAGRAIVLALADEGCNVAFCDIVPEPEMEDFRREVERKGVRALAVRCDVSKVEDVARLVALTVLQLGTINVVVNNAGIGPMKAFEELTEEDWDHVMAVNLKGPFLLCRAAMPWLKSSGYGRIINIGSFIVARGAKRYAHYVASKGGVVAFTKSLAQEVAQYGITVNTVNPGRMRTAFLAGVIKDSEEKYKADTPLGRVGEPEDLAPAVVFLASQGASYITGAHVDVNGGVVMW